MADLFKSDLCQTMAMEPAHLKMTGGAMLCPNLRQIGHGRGIHGSPRPGGMQL